MPASIFISLVGLNSKGPKNGWDRRAGSKQLARSSGAWSSGALLPPCIIPRCLFHSRECQGDFSLTDRPPGSMGASPKCRDHYHDQGSQGALQIMMLILKSFACRRSLLWPKTSVLWGAFQLGSILLNALLSSVLRFLKQSWVILIAKSQPSCYKIDCVITLWRS